MSAVPDQSEFRRGRNRLATIIVAGHAVKHVYTSGLGSIILPELKIGMELNSAQFGSLVTARTMTAGISNLTAGYLSDMFSNRAGLMIGVALGLMGIGHLVAGYAPTYPTMLLAMAVIGIGPSMFHPPAIGMLSRRFPDRRGFAVSLHGMGANLGEMLGPITVAGILSFLLWRDVLKFSSIPAILIGFVIWASIHSLQGNENSGITSVGDYKTSIKALLKNRVLLVLVLAVALRAIGESAITVFLPVLLREELRYSSSRVAIYLTSSRLAGLASQPIMGFLSDRFGRKAILSPATALTSLLAFGLIIAEPGIQLLIIIIANGAFGFALHHIFVAAAIDASRGSLQSTVVSLIYGAGVIAVFSPYVAGIIADRWGIDGAFIYGGTVLILPVLLLLSVQIPRQDTIPDTTPTGLDRR